MKFTVIDKLMFGAYKNAQMEVIAQTPDRWSPALRQVVCQLQLVNVDMESQFNLNWVMWWQIIADRWLADLQ